MSERQEMVKKKLQTYIEKRDFTKTPEPKAGSHAKSKQPIFVIHKHDARSLHYDLRLEDEGVLRSWAIPKGPSSDPSEKHLAIHVEDHPFDYKDFEGVIPKGNYGAGGVIIWDKGTFENLKDKSLAQCIEDGTVAISFNGEKLHGAYALIKTNRPQKDAWLFFKMKDDEVDVKHDMRKEHPESVVSGKTVEEIEEEGDE